MTCVVGLAARNTVWMAADSGISNTDGNLTVANDPKILRFDDFLIGCAGSALSGQIIEMFMKQPSLGPNPYENVAKYLVPAMKKTLKAQDLEWRGSDEYLVGHRGKLFHLDGNGYTLDLALPYWAIGSGVDIGLAVMYSTRDSRKPPEWRVERAVETACFFKDSCLLPIKLEVLG